MLVTVVGAAVIRSGRVLAARRTRPPELVGRWEFPGGKVESSETEPAALVREIREELDAEVHVGRELARATSGTQVQLVVYLCELVGRSPQQGADHDRLRWLTGLELDTVDWLDADREVLPAVHRALDCASRPSS